MSQYIRGWRKVNGAMQAQSAARWASSQQHNVGFRLAHDGAGQRDRGGIWDGHADSVASVRSWEDRPDSNLEVIGFRLVWDRP